MLAGSRFLLLLKKFTGAQPSSLSFVLALELGRLGSQLFRPEALWLSVDKLGLLELLKLRQLLLSASWEERLTCGMYS